MLEFDSAAKRFGALAALDGCSFRARPGRLTGFLGPNGAGKTTAMRAVFGLVELDAGAVRWRGAPITVAERMRFGYMPEERGLYPKQRVLDQLVYLGELSGMSTGEARRSAQEHLERFGLAERAGERVEKLSLGNQQRVQIIAALMNEPLALILDEPFSGLDPTAVDSMADLLREETSRSTPVLFSSHQLDLVEGLCESVAVIDQGHLVMSGRVADLKEASGRRELRLDLEAANGVPWDRGMEGVRVMASDAGGVRLALDPGVDALAVLDAARAAGRVRDFALEQPTLAELFLESVGRGRAP
jgi:ABC-2 type transport system ATP-binding protein